MSNNAPDYNNLAFEPEMTWEELKVKARELGYIANVFCIREKYGNIHYWHDGRISYDFPDDSFLDISLKRTPYQMYQIMLALKD